MSVLQVAPTSMNITFYEFEEHNVRITAPNAQNYSILQEQNDVSSVQFDGLPPFTVGRLLNGKFFGRSSSEVFRIEQLTVESETSDAVIIAARLTPKNLYM